MFDLHENPISEDYCLDPHVYGYDEGEDGHESEEDSYPDGYPDELIPSHAFM
jgi:hypothetical protein